MSLWPYPEQSKQCATAVRGRWWAEPLVQPARGTEQPSQALWQYPSSGRTGLHLQADSPAASGNGASAKATGRGSVNEGLGWFPFPILHIFGGLKTPFESAGYAVRTFFCFWKCCSCTELPSFSTFFSSLRWKCTSKRMYYLQTCTEARSSRGWITSQPLILPQRNAFSRETFQAGLIHLGWQTPWALRLLAHILHSPGLKLALGNSSNVSVCGKDSPAECIMLHALLPLPG